MTQRDQQSEYVRMDTELIEQLETEGSDPVHVFGIERYDDGTLRLILRTPAAEYDGANARAVLFEAMDTSIDPAAIDSLPESVVRMRLKETEQAIRTAYLMLRNRAGTT